MHDDDEVVGKNNSTMQYSVGQDISTMSVEQLEERIAAFQDEIVRTEKTLAERGKIHLEAEALFRK